MSATAKYTNQCDGASAGTCGGMAMRPATGWPFSQNVVYRVPPASVDSGFHPNVAS
jgi:hypothetical protein